SSEIFYKFPNRILKCFLVIKVIFVLSRNFVNSEWCNYELYFAQQRAIGKTFSDVILIVKEPIDPTSLPSKFCKLKRMLNTKTYLEWPQQPTEQSFFWVQLRSFEYNFTVIPLFFMIFIKHNLCPSL
uniref:TIR domain-containing protein n=1 Tax=Sinocyclocheilus rhinocerous TaxID=307959 RepID=A0A673FNT9_9TELE